MSLVDDPLQGGIADFGRRLRAGETSAVAATEAYLDRIAALDPALRAYEHVAAESARRSAAAIDALLGSCTDLGPLMGVPIAIKDIIHVDGMPTTAGSNVDVSDIIGGEGTFVRALRQAGCVILGKAMTVEFAIGSTGTNYNRGTPRNPWDTEVFRLPSGSSSGSGVAVAAGLCGFAIGTDTGGSIRGPAAFCGTFGLKTSPGTWPLDGVFPMSKTLDTIGPMTKTAADAAVVWAALSGREAPAPRPVRALRLGRPKDFMFDGLDADVARCMERALAALGKAGAEIVEIDVPEIVESNTVFVAISRPELVATFGRKRFLASKDRMNPDVSVRIAPGLEISTDDYIRSLWRHRDLIREVPRLFGDVDAWVGPAKQRVAPEFSGGFVSVDTDAALLSLCAGPTRPANVLGLCASSQPIQAYGSRLPVGFQLMCPGGTEHDLLSIALACENVFGPQGEPQLAPFVGRPAAAISSTARVAS
jgi:aspartyl-tRNA(Asn)/glutamyl-tRNA(Gln) amidotransferase subunit A